MLLTIRVLYKANVLSKPPLLLLTQYPKFDSVFMYEINTIDKTTEGATTYNRYFLNFLIL
jgi:hypothetical protein